MVIAKYKHPKLTTRKVWAGLYGGHYDVIVFFKEKPKMVEGESYINPAENHDLIIGDMYLNDFYLVFPNADISKYTQDENGRPKEIEIPEVFEMKLTSYFDKDGDLGNIRFEADW